MSKTYKNINIYGVYENDAYQGCIFTGNIHEIAKEFNVKETSIYSSLCRNCKIQGNKGKRYLIYKLYKENDKEVLNNGSSSSN